MGRRIFQNAQYQVAELYLVDVLTHGVAAAAAAVVVAAAVPQLCTSKAADKYADTPRVKWGQRANNVTSVTLSSFLHLAAILSVA